MKPPTPKQIALATYLRIHSPDTTPRHILKKLIDQALKEQKEQIFQAYEDVAEEVKQRADLLGYVGDMRRAGRVYQGLCPFHAEKTGSFTVYPDSNSWYCFGACQEGGDVISFIQKRYNLDFSDALKSLADDCGIRLPDNETMTNIQKPLPPKPASQPKRSKRYKWQDMAWQTRCRREVAEAAERLGWNNGYAEEARNYLKKRSITTSAIEAFSLGQLVSTRWDPKAKQEIPLGNAITIPWQGPNGTIKAVQHRLINHPQRFNQKAGGQRTLFGTHLIQPSKERILIVYEGEFNAISSWKIANEDDMPICSVSFGPEQNATEAAPLIERLSSKYWATIVWADKIQVAQQIPANLHLQSYNQQDANDLLKTGQLRGILSKCLTHFGYSQE